MWVCHPHTNCGPVRVSPTYRLWACACVTAKQIDITLPGRSAQRRVWAGLQEGFWALAASPVRVWTLPAPDPREPLRGRCWGFLTPELCDGGTGGLFLRPSTALPLVSPRPTAVGRGLAPMRGRGSAGKGSPTPAAGPRTGPWTLPRGPSCRGGWTRSWTS